MIAPNKFIKENPRIAISGIVFIGTILILFAVFGKDIIEKWPTKSKINEQIALLEKKQKELQNELNQQNIIVKNREAYIKNNSIFWIPKRDGDPEANAQKIVETAASSAGVSLTNIGKVQSAKIVDGLNTLDISLQTTAPMENVMNFIEEIYKNKPRFYWVNISLAPDNVRTPQKVMLNGSLRFISITDDEIVSKLIGETNEK